jgi:hypothetical protein
MASSAWQLLTRSDRFSQVRRGTYGSVLTAHPGKSRGGQLGSEGAQPVEITACLSNVLSEPVPEHRQPRRPDTTASGPIFMSLQPPTKTLSARPQAPVRASASEPTF